MLLFPDTQRKAQEEIDRIVGSDRLPEMSDLPQLPYLANLVRELLRWQPVLPLGKPLIPGVIELLGLYYTCRNTPHVLPR